ncbi:MAG TPA: type II toxin-antitoxin system prevent-host-death family antitoxin [Silvibacterium sp.]|jgi:prevent-host-death family protein|nr:type II toxin-antitoxin system prevent-host-death family antitoxin [Silvibacterium sp.]
MTSHTVAIREVQASEAKARLLQLLDDVEQGATLIITRHGRPIARLVPETGQRQAEIDQAIARIKARRRTASRVTVQELLSARDQGRR